MNYALAQRAPRKHPVGLVVVVGAHVLLAALFLSAKIVKTQQVDPPVTLIPDAPPPPKRVEQELPLPDRVLPVRHEIIIPPVDIDSSEPTVTARVDPTPHAEEAPVIAAVDPRPVASEPTRIQPHPAVINAAASQCRPEYPPAASREGATGVSKIRFTVDASGKVSNALILGSSGPTRAHRLLDKAAADALQACPIQVGTDEMGRPVGTTTDVEYVWRLN